MINPIDIINYKKRIYFFPNGYIAYIIMLTISVSVVSIEGVFQS